MLGEPKCYRCGKPISFDSNIKSKSGKYIPLDPKTNTPHNCPKADFSKTWKPKSQIKKGYGYVKASIAVIIIGIIVIGAFQAGVDNNSDKTIIGIRTTLKGQFFGTGLLAFLIRQSKTSSLITLLRALLSLVLLL